MVTIEYRSLSFTNQINLKKLIKKKLDKRVTDEAKIYRSNLFVKLFLYDHGDN